MTDRSIHDLTNEATSNVTSKRGLDPPVKEVYDWVRMCADIFSENDFRIEVDKADLYSQLGLYSTINELKVYLQSLEFSLKCRYLPAKTFTLSVAT